jgi:hypothetical protein
MQTKERPLKASSYRQALKTLRRYDESVLVGKRDVRPDVVWQVGPVRVVVEYRPPFSLQHHEPNPFLMGAGLAFNLGGVFKAPTLSSEEALARDGVAVARDMWIAIERRLMAKSRAR